MSGPTLRDAEAALRAFGIEFGGTRQAQLIELDVDALQSIHSRIAEAKTWPM